MDHFFITKKQLLETYEINSVSSNKISINEAKWYNTVLDILGIVDPTPTIDTINAISYWKQGDKFLALMSFLSAIPYGGDLIGKSAMAAAKMGKGSAKGLSAAIKLIEKDPAKAVKLIGELSKGSGSIAKLLQTSNKWGPTVIQKVSKLPKLGGFSEFISKVIAFFMRNPRKMKTLYKIAPSGGNGGTKTKSITPMESDPLFSFFEEVFTK